MSETEITHLIGKVAHGDAEAEQVLWEKYFTRLADYARRKLEDMPRRAADEEDVALSAMFSFCRGMAAGRFDRVDSRYDLWKLLVTITARKACAERRRHFAEKRGGGRVAGESVFPARDGRHRANDGMGALLGNEPTPELTCMVADECRHRLDALEDESLREVAILTLEGHTPTEIADKLGCVRRTVERKLERIHRRWSKAAAE